MASAWVACVSCLLLASILDVSLAQISDSCLECMCEAVAGGPYCVINAICQKNYCGPYSITLPYWEEGGRPTVGLEHRQPNAAYEVCTRDKACAQITIRSYMSRYQKDCDGDGVVDCEDYTAIHFYGPNNCNKPLNVKAQNALQSCLQRDGSSQQRPRPADTFTNDLSHPAGY